MDTSPPESKGGLSEELRGDASDLTATAKSHLHSEVDARKGEAVSQAQSLSSALNKAAQELDQSPDWIKSAFRQGAQTVQRFAESIEGKDSRALTRDVQRFARENPTTFLASCAVAGFAAARVMKAGAETGSANYGLNYGDQRPHIPSTATGGPQFGSVQADPPLGTAFNKGIA
ncbi:MAG: hypothetical protein V4579_02440 [Pseudomonadota bacterium]